MNSLKGYFVLFIAATNIRATRGERCPIRTVR